MKKKYKVEYAHMEWSPNGSIFYIVFKRRFGIWWPMKSDRYHFGILNGVNERCDDIYAFNIPEPLLEIRNRPTWYWIDQDDGKILSAEFNDMDSMKMHFAEYLI